MLLGALRLPQPVLAFPRLAVQLSLMNQRLCDDDDEDDGDGDGDEDDDDDDDDDEDDGGGSQ